MPALFKDRPLIAYFPMWHDNQNWLTTTKSRLANVNSAVNMLILSFVDPAKHYSGSLDDAISDYFFEGKEKILDDIASLKYLKEAIHLCKVNCTGRKVLVSAGGAIGSEFMNVNFESLAQLIVDLGLDGLDLDYEPEGGMAQTPEQVAIYQQIITDARFALDAQTQKTGQKYILSCAPTGVGLLSENEQDSALLNLISARLTPFIAQSEQPEALRVGHIFDEPSETKSCALSLFNFQSSGKMCDVFLHKSSLKNYTYIGNMVDLVIYQAYNMGSANLLGRLLCYESHRTVADFLQNETGQSGFRIIHGSHIGQEAFPRFSHTLSRLTAIYSYICLYGREGDGAGFWAYGQDATDTQDYLPAHGMGYTDSEQVFDSVDFLHHKYDTVAP